jgi:hypothetical protein
MTVGYYPIALSNIGSEAGIGSPYNLGNQYCYSLIDRPPSGTIDMGSFAGVSQGRGTYWWYGGNISGSFTIPRGPIQVYFETLGPMGGGGGSSYYGGGWYGGGSGGTGGYSRSYLNTNIYGGNGSFTWQFYGSGGGGGSYAYYTFAGSGGTGGQSYIYNNSIPYLPTMYATGGGGGGGGYIYYGGTGGGGGGAAGGNQQNSSGLGGKSGGPGYGGAAVAGGGTYLVPVGGAGYYSYYSGAGGYASSGGSGAYGNVFTYWF